MTPVAKLHWYGMGRFLVVHGVPYTGGSCSGGGGGWLVTQHIDLSEYGGASSALERPQEQALQPALLLPADPVGHWRFLKDGLVLPLLLGVCRGFGLAPPLGITVLPLELQMLVVGRLEVRQLNSLMWTSNTAFPYKKARLLVRAVASAVPLNDIQQIGNT